MSNKLSLFRLQAHGLPNFFHVGMKRKKWLHICMYVYILYVLYFCTFLLIIRPLYLLFCLFLLPLHCYVWALLEYNLAINVYHDVVIHKRLHYTSISSASWHFIEFCWDFFFIHVAHTYIKRQKKTEWTFEWTILSSFLRTKELWVKKVKRNGRWTGDGARRKEREKKSIENMST